MVWFSCNNFTVVLWGSHSNRGVCLTVLAGGDLRCHRADFSVSPRSEFNCWYLWGNISFFFASGRSTDYLTISIKILIGHTVSIFSLTVCVSRCVSDPEVSVTAPHSRSPVQPTTAQCVFFFHSQLCNALICVPRLIKLSLEILVPRCIARLLMFPSCPSSYRPQWQTRQHTKNDGV